MVGPGQMLTAAHAIAGADDDLHVVALDGQEHSVRVVAFDDQRDLALLQVDDFDSRPVQLGQPVEGDRGVITSISRDLELRVIDYRIVQVVIARSGDIYDEGEVLRTALELDATIEPGDSGAPLIDDSNQMVGTVFARSTGTGAGEAWALHPDEINAFLATATDVAVGDVEVDRGRCR